MAVAAVIEQRHAVAGLRQVGEAVAGDLEARLRPRTCCGASGARRRRTPSRTSRAGSGRASGKRAFTSQRRSCQSKRVWKSIAGRARPQPDVLDDARVAERALDPDARRGAARAPRPRAARAVSSLALVGVGWRRGPRRPSRAACPRRPRPGCRGRRTRSRPRACRRRRRAVRRRPSRARASFSSRSSVAVTGRSGGSPRGTTVTSRPSTVPGAVSGGRPELDPDRPRRQVGVDHEHARRLVVSRRTLPARPARGRPPRPRRRSPTPARPRPSRRPRGCSSPGRMSWNSLRSRTRHSGSERLGRSRRRPGAASAASASAATRSRSARRCSRFVRPCVVSVPRWSSR